MPFVTKFYPLGGRWPTNKSVEALRILKAKDAHGLPFTYAEIMSMVGLCNQTVRRIAARKLGETGKYREHLRRAIEFKDYRFTPKGFTRLVNRWLAPTGFAYCHVCHQAKPAMASRGKCAQCNAQKVRAYKSTERGADKCRAWKKANYHKILQYQKKHRDRKQQEKHT